MLSSLCVVVFLIFLLIFFPQRACEEALCGLQFFSSRNSTAENMALKRSTSVHQGKLDATGNDSATATSSTSGNLGFVPQTKHSINIKGVLAKKKKIGVEITTFKY